MFASTRYISRLILLVAVSVSLGTPAQADRGRERWRDVMPESYAPHQVDERRVSIDEAIDIVVRRTGGRVLEARDRGAHYRIKVLTRDKEVMIVHVNARTGEMR